MAVAYDSVGPTSGGTGNGGAATLSWSHTVAAASGVAIVVVVTLGANSTAQQAYTLSVTCGGTAMTSLGKVATDNATQSGYVQMFGITGQTSGAKTIAVTASGTPQTLTAGSVGFSGAGSFGTAVTAYGSSAAPTVAVTGASANNMMTCGICAGSPISSATSPLTSRWLNNASGSTGAGEGAQGTVASAAGSVSMAWSITSDYWGAIGVEVIASAAAALPPRPLRVARQAIPRSYNF